MANGQKEISGKHTHFIVHLCLCMEKMAHICQYSLNENNPALRLYNNI